MSIPDPVRRVFGLLARQYVRVYGVFWIIVVLAWFVATFITARLTTVETSIYMIVGQASPKWFLFVLGIITAATAVPQYIALGITRRHAYAAAGILASLTAVAFAVLTLAVFLLEAVVFDRTGLSDGLTQELPVSSVGRAVTLVAVATLMFVLWAVSGWSVGLGYYRFGPWIGTLLATPIMAPLALGEIAVRNEDPGAGFSGLSSLPPTLTGLLITTATALAALVGYLLVRDMPIRKVSG